MAKLLKNSDYGYYIEMARSEGDKSMSPGMMKAYLQYRLYMVEAQIRVLLKRIGIDNLPSSAQWDWMQDQDNRDSFASWASLNYLMNAREDLLIELESLPQQTIN
ncbi:MAG: hypothetical protein ACOX9A_02815 [Anaerolineae bacterium]